MSWAGISGYDSESEMGDSPPSRRTSAIRTESTPMWQRSLGGTQQGATSISLRIGSFIDAGSEQSRQIESGSRGQLQSQFGENLNVNTPMRLPMPGAELQLAAVCYAAVSHFRLRPEFSATRQFIVVHAFVKRKTSSSCGHIAG